MSISTSPEFFINIKNPPIYDNSKHYWEQDNDVLQFYEEEKRKFTEGITINGVFIPPWLYFHCNFYTAPIPKNGKDILQTPGLRDNEWYFAENYEDAKKNNKHLFIMGSRRYSKTTIEGSVVHWTAIVKPNSQSFLMGGSSEDLDMLTKGLRTGMTEMNPAFYMENNSNDWGKHIQLGLKTKSNTPLVYHDVYIRNLESGQDKKSEKTAGGTPSGFVVDEAAKFACKAMWSAALPSFKTPQGNRCVGILTACVCAGTKVWNNTGDLVNIEDLKPEQGIIGFDLDNQVMSKESITYWQTPQQKECYRIETHAGRVLECSADHPILKRSPNLVDYRHGRRNGFRKMGFEETQNLIIGDTIGIIQQVDIFGTKEMWAPRLVGLLVGDGSYGFDKTPILSNCDKDVNEYVYSNFDAVRESGYITKDGREYKETRIRKICPNLRELGIYGQTKHKKTLPLDIHSYRKEDICEFIGGFFDADGCVQSTIKNNMVNISSMSKTLVQELQLLLQKLGIHGGISKRVPTQGKSKSNNPYYVLTVADRRSLMEFHKNIHFLIKYKQDKLNTIVINLKDKKDGIEKRLNNLRFERVVSIEKIGIRPVYNLTAGNTNTYVANGIITHNTGGNVNLSQDAITMLKDPDAYELLAMNWDRLENRIEEKDLITWKRTKFGIFVPGQMGYETGNEKKETNLKEYLKVATPSPELEKIKIGVTDWRLAQQIILNNRKLKLKDKSEHDKYTMYHPLDPSECTIISHTNPFPANEAQKHRQYLIDNGLTGKLVDLTLAGGKVEYTLSDKRPVEFPFSGGTHDAPVMMFTEFPLVRPPYGLNVSGLDPYKQTKSGTDSVGAFYVLRREGLLNDPLAGCILASYCSRPAIPDNFDRTCEWLIESFNAQCLMENADIGFIRYLERRNKAEMLLANGVDFSKKINPNASANTPYGLYPTPKNQSHLIKGLLNYCNEELVIGFDEEGEPLKALGITRINDIYLLDEIINYKAGGNFDRMIAFAHAIAWADYLDTIGIKVESGEQQEKKEQKKKVQIKKFFTDTSGYNRWR